MTHPDTSTAATERPWRASGRLILGSDGEQVATVATRSGGFKQRSANAALIVTAVNERDSLLSDLAAARAEVERLRAVANEAIDEAESWAAYASDYFKEKHDLKGVVTDLRARVAQ